MNKNTEVIFGIHAVEQVVNKRPECIINLWVQDNLKSSTAKKLLHKLNRLDIRIQFVNRKTLDKMTNDNRHQGILIEVKGISTNIYHDLESVISKKTSDSLYLILDSIQDPHNFGACIRTAVAAGVEAIIIPKNKAVSVNETVRKVASGAAENIIIITVVNITRTIKSLKEAGIWIVGTASELGTSLYELDLTMPTAIVMGNEESGIRSQIKKECDYIASIPISGKIDSLNISVAAGVILFEAVRQRKANSS